MRSTLTRLRAPSLSHHLTSTPPPPSSGDYSLPLANLAARILYSSPLPSQDGLPVYILDAAAFPDAKIVDYDALLPYVLARLPGEEELIGGEGYEIVFFAGWTAGSEGGNRAKTGGTDGKTGAHDSASRDEGGHPGGSASGGGGGGTKRSRPGWGWFLQAYQVLSRAMRKRLRKLYVVHEKGWIRVVMEMFATIVSPKVRKKVVHVSSLTALALHIPIEDLLIPPSAYTTDRCKSPEIYAPFASGRRAFGVKHPLPESVEGGFRLPRVLRETTSFVLAEPLSKTEGLLRVSARAQTVEILKEAYDRGQKFIVWKDLGTTMTFPYFKEGIGTVSASEVDHIDGYDVHAAAALIKLWYHELRDPIFPPASYQALGKLYGDPSKSPDPQELGQMLSPGTEFSPIPETSRAILIAHLLPFAAHIARDSDSNRMTPTNLAVVFAPNLVCGPDPIEDLKISAIVQRLLAAMIMHWTSQIAPSLGRSHNELESSLRTPKAVAEREDALEELRNGKDPDIAGLDEQTNGIILLDNDGEGVTSSSEEDDADDEQIRPPLPARPRTNTIPAAGTLLGGGSSASPVRRKPTPVYPDIHPAPDFPTAATIEASNVAQIKRKPAPAVAPLPRYSTIITNRPAVMAALEQYNSTYNTGEASDEVMGDPAEFRPEFEHLPAYEANTDANETSQPSATGLSSAHAEDQHIPRKPVSKGTGLD